MCSIYQDLQRQHQQQMREFIKNIRLWKFWLRNINTNNEEMKDIMKIVNSLKDSGLLIEGITETIENETKEQRVGFLV